VGKILMSCEETSFSVEKETCGEIHCADAKVVVGGGGKWMRCNEISCVKK
jgi:hypothetical protein